MKKLLLPVVLALLSVLIINSCKSNDPIVNTTLKVDESDVQFAYSVGKQIILVNTDATSWSTTVTMNEQKENLWCSVTKGSKDITIRLKENFIKSVRTAVISIDAPGLPSVKVTVTQAAALHERDPFWTDYNGGVWNTSWTYYDAFLHQQGSADKWKLDPIVYNKSEIPAAWMATQMGSSITAGLKLDSKFLTEFNNRHLYRFELNTNGAVQVTFAILKMTSVVTNIGSFPDYVTETVRTQEMWRSQTISAPTDVATKPNWWAICDASTGQTLDYPLTTTDGELYLVAYITGGGSTTTAYEFEYCVQQLNPLISTYVSFTGVTGQDLYHFIGGTACLNFYMSEPK